MDDIAERIVSIILAPETVTGLINGATTVPLDLGYLVWGYFDTESRWEHQTQQIRITEAIRKDILNYEHITSAVEIIFKEFNKYLTINQQNKVYRGVAASILGRLTTAKIIAIIGGAVLARFSFVSAKKGVSWVGKVTMLLMIGGMSERSIRTSERLAHDTPEIYKVLRPHDYDLTYFLFEPAVKPFVDAIHVGATRGQNYFDKIIEVVEGKLDVTN